MAFPTPTLFYNFNEVSGNALDAVGGVVATNNSVTYGAGLIGNQAIFNGSAFFSVPHSAVTWPTNDITFGGFFIIDATSSFQMMMAKGENAGDTRSFEMRCSGTTTKPEVQMRIGGGSYIQARGNTPIGTGVRKFVVYRRTGTTHQILIDNVVQTLEASITNAANIDYSTDDFWMGQRNGALRFNGKADMLGVFPAYLTDAELAEWYNAGAGREWPFVTPSGFFHFF